MYDISSGRRVALLRLGVTHMNDVFIRTYGLINMSFVGVGDSKRDYTYDLYGNYISDRPTSEYLKYVTDENENKYYEFRDDDGVYLTGAHGFERVVSGKYDIAQDIEKSPYFMCTVKKGEETVYQIYDFDGVMHYESTDHTECFTDEFFISYGDDGARVGRISDGEILFDVRGTKVSEAYDEYFVTYDENAKVFFLYKYDGSETDEVCNGCDSCGDWNELVTVYKDGKRYILDRDLSVVKIIDGKLSWVDRNFYVIRNSDAYIFTDKNWNEIMRVEEGCNIKYKSDVVLIYPDRGTEGLIRAYDINTLEQVWSDTAALYLNKKQDGAVITQHYVLTQKNGVQYLNNITTGKAVEVNIPESSSYTMTEEYGMVRLEIRKSFGGKAEYAVLYDENMEKLFEDPSISRWTDKYVICERNNTKYLHDLHGNYTGITAYTILDKKVSGKRFIITYDNPPKGVTEFESRSYVYDYDSLEPLFELAGSIQSYPSEGDYMRTYTGYTANYISYDENGVPIRYVDEHGIPIRAGKSE